MPLATIYGETTPSIAYRDGIKYILTRAYVDKVPIYPDKDIVTEWVELTTRGELLLRLGFAYDGPSGALDTKSAMRGSAKHDAFYRLFRLGLLDAKWQAVADRLYEDDCIADAKKTRKWWMPEIIHGPLATARFKAHFAVLRAVGWKAAAKGTEPPTLTAP